MKGDQEIFISATVEPGLEPTIPVFSKWPPYRLDYFTSRTIAYPILRLSRDFFFIWIYVELI